MRNEFARKFHELSKQDSKLCIVVADISPAGAMEEFRNEFPNRFINTGVAEQTMIGMVAGMAMQGLKPFAYTIATFSLYRPFEFIRNDLCYQNLPVTVVGIGGGVTYSTLGGTHHAQEDISIALSLPNISIIAPCDPYETSQATLWCAKQNEGPVYLRLGKAGEKILHNQQNFEKFTFGKIRYIEKGKDVCVIGYGPILNLAQRANESLKENCSIISVHTIKPLDLAGIIKVIHTYKKIIVLEEMSPIGGLFDIIRTIAWEQNALIEIKSLSLKDKFIHVYGSHEELLKAHGISVENLIKEIIN